MLWNSYIAALRFQPSRRPQIATQKAKTKPTGFARPAASASAATAGLGAGSAISSETDATNATSSTPANGNGKPQAQSLAAKATLADWTANGNDDDDANNNNANGFNQGGEKRQRGGRKKKKNKGNRGGEAMQIMQDWDDIYDPTRPNSYEEYVNSDEKRREIREWKEKLYAHRRARRRDSVSSSESEERGRPAKGRGYHIIFMGSLSFEVEAVLSF